MQLWTEYEGRTIEGAYTLGKLLRSEGRNGFFATSDTTGNSAVIRLTEAHYDEDELLKRWRQVSVMHQDNLIEIERYGQTNFDGVPLTYALMEPNDANLGDVLRERPLTVTETTQVAKSVLSALIALHASGLVHEFIEPANILAVGDIVKLRSDCVRECVPDGTEFNTPESCAELRRRDVHDFGILLLRCLTLEKQLTRSMRLPAPFDRVIPGAVEGTWTLEQIRSVLDPTSFATKASAPAAPAARTPAATSAPAPSSTARAAAVPAKAPAPAAAGPDLPQQRSLDLGLDPAVTSEPAIGVRSHRDLADEPAAFSLKPVWILCTASAILLVLLLWHVLGAKPATPAAVTRTEARTSAPTTPAPVVVRHPGREIASVPAAVPAVTPAPLAAHAPGWYVIAFTYNHQPQAQAKAEKVNSGHRGLHAEVFNPRGGTYLVSLGGPMSESEAKALQKRARRSGMPRDTYIRNYK